MSTGAKKKKKKRLTKKERLNRAIGILIFTVCMILAVTLVYFVFLVDEVSVAGNISFTDEYILKEADIHAGTHIWLIDEKKAVSTLREDPYIGSAKIERIYPNKVCIVIEERVEAAVIEGLGASSIVDMQGYVLKVNETTERDDLIRISGAGSTGYQVNKKIASEDDYHLRSYVTLMEAISNADLTDQIAEIDISNALSVSMTTRTGYSVHIGQINDLDKKFSDLRTVLPVVEARGFKSGTIDLAVRGDPVYSPANPEYGTSPVTPTDTPVSDTDTP